MNTQRLRKQENSRGHLSLVRIERGAAEQAHLELIEAVYALAVPGQRPRRFHKIAAGELHPLRLLDRLTDDAVKAQLTEEQWCGAVLPVVRSLIRRKFRKGRSIARRSHDATPAA